MFRVRSLSTTLLIASTLLGAATALVAPEAAADKKVEGPCKHGNKVASVKAACAKGGDKGGMEAAKDVMEGFKKALKGKKVDFVCGDCHNKSTWALLDNAEADFKKLKDAHPDIIK